MEKMPKFGCQDCHKILKFEEIHMIPGEMVNDPEFGLPYSTTARYCNDCYNIRLGAGLNLIKEEIEEIILETDENVTNIINLPFKIKQKDNDFIIVNIFDQDFIFDEEGFNKFKEKFYNPKEYNLIIDNGYLSRRNKISNRLEWFHRWFMNLLGEVSKFADMYRLELYEVDVHHCKENKLDNRFSSLECKSHRIHMEEHEEERAWNNYRKEYAIIWYIKDRERFRSGFKLISEKERKNKFHDWWLLQGAQNRKY